ncbi:hypothetical protein AN958_04006 [Leucoagaricus sp. SymC.cos]|nr:hypothetical protein AN958_04006 [Leucoagaricus sp. SymC.cos]
MINRPDIHLNAAMNQWIVAILMFDFELVHVLASRHKGLDGLSRQRKSEDGSDDNEGEEVVEEWVDEILGCSVWAAAMAQDRALVLAAGTVEDGEGTILKERARVDVEELTIPSTEGGCEKDLELNQIRKFLGTMTMPEGLTVKAKICFLKCASKFFIRGRRLWRKEMGGRHQVVVMDARERFRLLIESHDQLGHKGLYAT